MTGDCDAVRDIETGHKYAKSAAEAGAVAIKAGLDNDCTTAGFGPQAGPPDYQRYVDALKQGLLTEAEVDVALKRMLRTRFELGLFDPPETVQAGAGARLRSSTAPRTAQLALQLARESMVLLKNDGLLPFAKPPARIAVVGPLADSPACCSATTTASRRARRPRSTASAGSSRRRRSSSSRARSSCGRRARAGLGADDRRRASPA